MKLFVNPPRVAAALSMGVCMALLEAHATSCSAPPEPLEAAEESDAVFVGTIADGGNDHHLLACAAGWLKKRLGLASYYLPCATGYITLSVHEQFKGGLGRDVTLVLDGPLQFRDRFAVGASLLVYAPRDDRGNLSFRECGRIMFLSDAADDLKALRARYPGDR